MDSELIIKTLKITIKCSNSKGHIYVSITQ